MAQKSKNNIRCTAQRAVLGLCLSIFFSPAFAHEVKTISGLAVVNDCGTLEVNGQKISLWGIDAVAPDQQCWQGEAAWGCGEEAIMALKHFVEGRLVECFIQTPADDSGPAKAKCYRAKAANKIDIAERMIKEGWALERGETSGGIYYEMEQDAQNNKRGIWSGRFQTAQDWKDGVQRFVGEDVDETSPAAAENNAQ